jgi:hypothetical protein
MNNDDQLNYNKPFDINEWKRLCKDAYDRLKHTRSVFQFIEALSQIDKMKCTLFTIARVECEQCKGTGEYNQDTIDSVCDKCWGTGRRDKTGLTLCKERRILSE